MQEFRLLKLKAKQQLDEEAQNFRKQLAFRSEFKKQNEKINQRIRQEKESERERGKLESIKVRNFSF